MDFNNTTTKGGIIQTIEFWTGLGDTGISSDATLLKVFTSRVNEAFDRLIPYLLSYSDYLRWDDENNTDLPVGTLSMVSGQSDYTIAQDDNSLSILNITNVSILGSTIATAYIELEKMSMDDPLAIAAMSPNSNEVGVPQYYLERGNTIFLYPQPNYSIAAGIKIFFERDPSYFVSTDTTKKPGIPRPFHGLLALIAAHDWILVNKSSETALITRLEAEILKRETNLSDMTSKRFPTRNKATTKSILFR